MKQAKVYKYNIRLHFYCEYSKPYRVFKKIFHIFCFTTVITAGVFNVRFFILGFGISLLIWR
jgi:hypothetical protein